MYQNTGGYSPITVIGLPHVRHPGELMTELHEAGTRLVCLTFAAGWCEPCRTLMAQYLEIMRKCEDVVFLLADVDECGGLQAYFRVTMVPTVVLIRRWEVVEMWVGCSAARLRRRLNLYRDADKASPPPKRTDLRRIYELIRDDTYMVTDQVREEQSEGESPGESTKPLEGESDEPNRPDWKHPKGLIRGPKSLGLTFAPKQTFPRDKNWRIADAYLTARRSKPSPVGDKPSSPKDGSDYLLGSQSSILHSSSDKLVKHPRLMDLLPEEMEEELEEEGEEEDEEEWEEDMASWRNSDWYQSIYDEWQEKRKTLMKSASGVEGGKEPPESKDKLEEPRPRRLSFADDRDDATRQSSRLESISSQPRGILKPKKDSGVTDEDDIMASSAWRKMQEEYRRRRASFTQRMMRTELEDRNYSRAEVLDLMKRCQRACTARNLDTQYHELVTDVAGQELLKAKRQRDLEESQARAERRALLMAAAKAKASRLTVTPRHSLAPALGMQRPSQSSGSATSMTQGSFQKESRKSPHPSGVRKSNVQSLRQSIAITAAHRSPASSRASMSSEAGLTLAAAKYREEGIEPPPFEVSEEGRDSEAEAVGGSLLMDKETRKTEIMLEEVETLRRARESEVEEDVPSESSDTKMKEKKSIRARLSKNPKVSFGSKDSSTTSLQSRGEKTYVDVKKLKTKEEMRSYAPPSDTTDTTEEEENKKKK